MKTRFFRLVLIAAVIGLGIYGWRLFFPNPEQVIRNRLGELAKAASFSSKEGDLARAWNASLLADYFTPDVQVRVEMPGSWHTINGRDELLRAALGVRSTVASLTVEFPDIKVTVAPDRASAVVILTAIGKVPGDRDFYLQELRMRLTKVKRDWLINQVETIRTLSLIRRTSPAGA
jgi:hypothetical protein